MFSGSNAVPATICPHDRQCRDADAIGLQIGAAHGGGGSERCFAEGNGRKGRNRMIRETAARHDDGAGATSRMAGATTCVTTMALMTSTA
jgi:hypothetical protein